eukprot:CAMPEP_0198515826 /NCGR_PEP_ID=MMETSP1462-20131121/17548_1 /TAXON_ID=1333877 /ORGANISM="Brandtodinium nutriculum, Strain RCC3387" /LENGTH=394 /DNA_ID=CAMNT_0044245333 /DNA_START=52 /DNA_END=1233 /DNA_ORIENTATION=-
MIDYDQSSWLDILIRWQGTILESSWPKIAIVFVYVSATYGLQLLLDCNFGYAWDHSYIVGRCLSFLLVFRANSSYEKYVEGRKLCCQFFAGLRNLVMLTCALFKGGHGQYVWNRRAGTNGFSAERRASYDDEDDRAASAARADIVRWALALANAFLIAMRLTPAQFSQGEVSELAKWKLNFTRMRLRTLLTKEEFAALDRALHVEDTGVERRLLWNSGKGEPHVFHKQSCPSMPGGKYRVSMVPSYRQLVIILHVVAQTVRLHANEPHGFKERFLPAFIGAIKHVNHLHDRVSQAITSPLPLPYVNLVRTLLMMYLLSIPFFVDYTAGVLANVGMPTLQAMALLGIDQIGTELENPFGEDINDLDFQAMIMGLEKEVLRTLELSGDTRARDMFT